MGKWLMALAFVVLVAHSSFALKENGGKKDRKECFERGKHRYFNCSMPILTVNDTRDHLALNFTSENHRDIFTLNMTSGEGFLNVVTIVRPGDLLENSGFRPSVSKFVVKMNISRSNVYLWNREEELWHRMNIPQTDDISYIYIPDYPDFCINCGGVEIWHNNNSIGQLWTSTTTSTEETKATTTQETEKLGGSDISGRTSTSQHRTSTSQHRTSTTAKPEGTEATTSQKSGRVGDGDISHNNSTGQLLISTSQYPSSTKEYRTSTRKYPTSTTVGTEGTESTTQDSGRAGLWWLCLLLVPVIILGSWFFWHRRTREPLHGDQSIPELQVMCHEEEEKGKEEEEADEHEEENDAYISADAMRGYERVSDSEHESENDIYASADAWEDENAYEIVD